MSVLFVCDHRFRRKEGKVYSNTFSYSLFRTYCEVFSHVTVVGRVCDVGDVSNMQEASGDGVDFVFLESISTPSSFLGLRKKYRDFLGNLMDDHDGVIVRLPTEFGLLAAGEARQRGKKCLVEVVGCAWDAMWNYGGAKAKLYAPFLYSRMKATVKHADFVIYVTERFLQMRYPCGKDAKSIGISDVQLEAADEKVLLRRFQKQEEASNKIVFGTIGSLTVDYKGIDTAITVLAHIARKGISFEYRILGEGDPKKYRTLAQKFAIDNKIYFDGTLPEGETVFRWLDHIDIYLQPSRQEGLPRSLIEAMSRACPVVGSDAGGIPELLDKDVIFPSGNTGALAAIIKELIADSTWMKNQAERNFNTARKYQASRLNQKRKKFLLAFRGY